MNLVPYIVMVVVIAVILLVIGTVIYAVTRRARSRESLPQHPYPPSYPSAPRAEPWESKIDLGSRPPEQVVVKEVPMLTCRYCRTMYPATTDRCPYCGSPRQ
jgi:hypothetical protein